MRPRRLIPAVSIKVTGRVCAFSPSPSTYSNSVSTASRVVLNIGLLVRRLGVRAGAPDHILVGDFALRPGAPLGHAADDDATGLNDHQLHADQLGIAVDADARGARLVLDNSDLLADDPV